MHTVIKFPHLIQIICTKFIELLIFLIVIIYNQSNVVYKRFKNLRLKWNVDVLKANVLIYCNHSKHQTDLFDLDRDLTGTTLLSQSGPGSNVNEKGLNMIQSSRRQLPQSDMMKNWTEGSHSLKETRSFV